MLVGSDLKDIPDFLRCMAELAACYAGTQAIVADTDRFVLEGISKVIMALGHGPNEDADALLRCQGLEIILHSYHGGLKTHCHFAAVGRKMIRDRVFNNSQQFFLRIGRTN